MRKLELGPGKKKIGNDWETMSVQPGNHIDYVCDITDPITIVPPNTFDLVYASHVLEHVPWFMVVQTLKHIKEIMVPGGKIELWVPDFKASLEVYRNPQAINNDKFRLHNKQNDPMLWINGRIFAGDTQQKNLYTKISVWHKCLFDKPFLVRCMEQAGFSNFFDLDKPRGYNHGWINLGVGAVK